MSTAPDKQDKLNNSDNIRSILQKSNDVLHQAVANKEIVVIATQNKQDKSKFTIVADSVYEKELEGCVLTFANPQDYLRLFPTEPGNTEPPIKCPPNTEYDPVSKKCVPIAPDSYTVLAVVSTPKSQTPQFNEQNVLDGKEDTKWAINQKGASLTLDLGSVVDVGTLWIWWGDGDKRAFYFNIGTSQTEDQDFVNIWGTDKMSSGKVNDFEPYNLVNSTSATPGLKCRFIHITVNGNNTNGDWAAISNIKITKNVAVESVEQDIVVTTPPPVVDPPTNPPPTTPPVDPNAEPQKPVEGRLQLEKGGNQDAKTWKPVEMQKQPELWKIVDDKGINIADQFTKKENCEITIKWYQWKQKQTVPPTTPPPVEPPTTPAEGNKDTNGVVIMKPIKPGGQVVSKTTVERSVHNQSNESNIKRDSIYGSPKSDKKNNTVNYATVMYINTELSKDDQIDNKRLGGGHGDDNPKEGRCYPVGVMINKGKASGPFIAKEYPQHSDTPKFSNECKVVRTAPLPDLNGKTFGMQTIGWSTGTSYKFECYLDLSVLDKSISELKTPPNNWELYYTAEDKGDWTGAPYLTHQGLDNGGTSLMMYGRIDHVTKPTEVAFAGAVEIIPPPPTTSYPLFINRFFLFFVCIK